MVTEDSSLQTAPGIEQHPRQKALNFDTLVTVMPWIKNSKDFLSFITSCSDLYAAGVSTLLGFHYMIKPRDLSLFHQFLTSKSPSSFLRLRSLHFPDVDMENPYVTSSLADIFGRAKNLQYIRITGGERNLRNLHPSLCQALASLRSLHSLELQDCWSDMEQAKMFAQLRSPMRSVELEGAWGYMDLVETLANFQHTLEKLVIRAMVLDHNPTGPSYPNLIHLSIECVGNPFLSILVPAFPNLQTLNIRSSSSFGDVKAEWRENGIQFYLDYPSQVWHLASLTGNTPSLFTLGLLIVVPDVTVVNFQPTRDCADIERCLRTLRPMKLSVSNDEDLLDGVDWLAEATVGCSDLVRLDLSFTLPSDVDQHETCFVGFVRFQRDMI